MQQRRRHNSAAMMYDDCRIRTEGGENREKNTVRSQNQNSERFSWNFDSVNAPRHTRLGSRAEAVYDPLISRAKRDPGVFTEIDYPIAHMGVSRERASAWYNICCNFIQPASITLPLSFRPARRRVVSPTSARSIFDSRRDRACSHIGSFLNF